MKKYVLIFLALPFLALTSCNDNDGYSLNKFWIGMATVENTANSNAFFLRSDNNNLLWVGATGIPGYRPRTGQRVIANYTILSDGNGNYQHDVRLNNAYNVLTKEIFNVTPATQDSIGNDPIGINDMWIGGNYLNVEFFYGGQNRRHFINLVSDASKAYNDGRIHLEFRHNAYDDPATYRFNGIASFHLAPLLISPANTPAAALGLTIHVLELNGSEKTYNFTYTPNQTSASTKEFTEEAFERSNGADVE